MKPEKKKINHCISEHNKNLLFLVRHPVLTTVSATTAYAGKMLWDRALLFRFTNWLIGIWPAAWQSHKSVMKPCTEQLPEMWNKCNLCRGREWLGFMVLVRLVLGWMDGAMYMGWILERRVSHRVGGCQSWRSPTPDHQICTGNWTEKHFPGVFCVKMNQLPVDLPADTGACSGPLASSGCCPETSACLPGCTSSSILPAQVRVHLSSQSVYHPHGSAQNVVWMMEITPVPAWGFNSQSTDPRESNVLPLTSRGNVSPLPAKEKSQLNS